jgi:Sec-independent protein translocase protein TatA
MRSGVSFSEIILILTLIIIFVNPKEIPGLLRKGMKIVARLRAEVRKFLDDVGKM